MLLFRPKPTPPTRQRTNSGGSIASTGTSGSTSTSSVVASSTTTRSSRRRKTTTTADLRRSSFGILMPSYNWKARKQQAVTYCPAVDQLTIGYCGGAGTSGFGGGGGADCEDYQSAQYTIMYVTSRKSGS